MISSAAAETGKQALGIPDEAGPIEVRRQILHRLRNRDYVPPPAEREAVCLLMGVRVEGQGRAARDPGARGIWHLRLRQEFDAFHEQFWKLSPRERRRQWEELTFYAGDLPTLRSRLKLLQPVLDVGLPDLQHEAVTVRFLGALISQLAILPAPRQASLQRVNLAAMETEESRIAAAAAAKPLRRKLPRAWLHAAEYLEQIYPRPAGLDGGVCLRELTAEFFESPSVHARRRRSLRRFRQRFVEFFHYEITTREQDERFNNSLPVRYINAILSWLPFAGILLLFAVCVLLSGNLFVALWKGFRPH